MRDSLSKPMTSRPAPVAAALVALLLGGCSLMPVYERPAAPVAEHWPGLAAPQGASAPVAAHPSPRCPKCAGVVQADDRFCEHCGHKLQ